MSNTLKLLHPFMPFITEEIWQALPHVGETIMLSPWCKYDEALNFTVEVEAMERIMTAIKAIRNRRAEMNVPPSKKAKLYIETKYTEDFKNGSAFFTRLASASDVQVEEKYDHEIEGAVSVITEAARIYIPLNELVDFEAEKARLNKELEAVKKDLEFVENKLNNPGFMAKAPEKVVAAQRESQEKYKAKIAMLQESLSKLQ